MDAHLIAGGGAVSGPALAHAGPKATWISIAFILVLVSGCAVPSASPLGAERAQEEQSRVRPTLTIAVQREPSTFSRVFIGAAESAGGLTVLKQIPSNQLAVLNDRNVWVPQLAADLPSVPGGTWRMNPDGTMDTVWKLRPNVLWHDGTPFTSQDLLFAFRLGKDPEVPNNVGPALAMMESAAAPDPLTLVVHWSTPYTFADQAPGLEPLPSHLLEAVYQKDKTFMLNSSLLGEGFVGLGAYRLTRWERGSYLEFGPFDDYYLGPPPLGKVLVRVIPDLNTIIANVYADALDVVMGVGVSLETGVQVRDRVEGSGGHVEFVPSLNPKWIEIQHRAEFAVPVNGLTNKTVRQAFLQGIDRKALVELATLGQGQVADGWVHPSEALFGELNPSLVKWPYNPARAQQLLADAGWIRGPSGALVNQPGGQSFTVEARYSTDGESDKVVASVASMWETLGAQVKLVELTPVQKSSNEFRAKFSGVAGLVGPDLLGRQLHSKYMASEENRWTGGRAGYNNPRFDALLERFWVAVDPAVQIPTYKDLTQLVSDDVVLFPLYFAVVPVISAKGVSGLKGVDAWNVQEWAKQ